MNKRMLLEKAIADLQVAGLDPIDLYAFAVVQGIRGEGPDVNPADVFEDWDSDDLKISGEMLRDAALELIGEGEA